MNLPGAFSPHQKPASALPCRCHVLSDGMTNTLEDYLVKQLPECYITVEHLQQRVEETKLSAADILSTKVPDPGSVMSGDFGEILALFFLSAECPGQVVPIKKWQYKQDRTKPAPHSDVVILHRESFTTPSTSDYVICGEAKQKATPSATFIPIQAAVESFSDDRIGRLARALAWLREKAIDQGSRSDIQFLNRFTVDAVVPFAKRFKAVAIVDRSLLDEEISRQLNLPAQDSSFEVIVLGIRDLQRLYETVFARAVKEATIE